MRAAVLRPPAGPTTRIGEGFLCPTCASAAKVEWRDWVESTSGPAELVKLRCASRHWFLMPADQLRRTRPHLLSSDGRS
jgi:hypothetical protein